MKSDVFFVDVYFLRFFFGLFPVPGFTFFRFYILFYRVTIIWSYGQLLILRCINWDKTTLDNWELEAFYSYLGT